MKTDRQSHLEQVAGIIQEWMHDQYMAGDEERLAREINAGGGWGTEALRIARVWDQQGDCGRSVSCALN